MEGTENSYDLCDLQLDILWLKLRLVPDYVYSIPVIIYQVIMLHVYAQRHPFNTVRLIVFPQAISLSQLFNGLSCPFLEFGQPFNGSSYPFLDFGQPFNVSS